MPEELVAAVDGRAESECVSRGEWVRRAVEQALECSGQGLEPRASAPAPAGQPVSSEELVTEAVFGLEPSLSRADAFRRMNRK